MSDKFVMQSYHIFGTTFRMNHHIFWTTFCFFSILYILFQTAMFSTNNSLRLYLYALLL